MIDLRRVERYARQLEFRFIRAGTELAAGRQRSVFRGHGLAFAECRDYQFGDEVRHIEWNATARLGRPFVKVFEEDRSAALLLLIDVSGSLSFGTPLSKADLACEVAALFALIGANSGERVGAVLFSDRIERCIWPRAGRSHGWAILRTLERYVPVSRGTDIANACTQAVRMMKKPGTVVIFSDFMDSGYERALGALAIRNNVLAVVLVDPREASLPRVGLLHVRDVETGKTRWVDTLSRRARQAQGERFRALQRARRELFGKLGVPSVEILTGRPYVAPLLQFCRPRGRLSEK